VRLLGTTDTFVNRLAAKPTKTCTERTPFECERGNKDALS